jgi:hypothetical protein
MKTCPIHVKLGQIKTQRKEGRKGGRKGRNHKEYGTNRSKYKNSNKMKEVKSHIRRPIRLINLNRIIRLDIFKSTYFLLLLLLF